MKKSTHALMAMAWLAVCVFTAQAQQEDTPSPNRIFDFIRSKRSQTETARRETKKVVPLETVIANINQHLIEAARLRALGKTAAEIQAHFNSRISSAATGIITGTLYESDGTTPIRESTSIEAYDEYGRFSGSGFISSFDHGVYAISRLATGNYYVRTESFGRYKDEYYNDTTDWQKATLVRVTDGQTMSGINFRLERRLVGKGVITGKVLNPAGQPITANVFIALVDGQNNFVNGSAVNDKGEYLFAGLPTGAYRLLANYSGSENIVDEWYDEATRFETATPVQVNSPDTTRNIDFKLNAGGVISGQARNPQGQPLNPNEFFIQIYDPDLRQINTQPVVHNNIFFISRLPTGNYKLFASYRGEANYVNTWYDRAANPVTAKLIAARAPDTTKNIVVTLLLAGAISGSVLDPNGVPVRIGEVRISAFDENRFESGMTISQNNGNYTLSRLPAGRYKLFAEYAGQSSFQQPINEWYDGAADFASGKFVEVVASNTTPNIDLTLVRGGAITGQVVGPQNRPLTAGGTVNLYDLKRKRVTFQRFGNNGIYVVGGLASGEYKLLVSYDGQEGYADEWYDGKLNFQNATPVRVVAPNVTAVNFTLDFSGRLNGFVKDAAGNRLAEEQVPVELFAYDSGSGEFVDFDFNSFNGGYRLDLLPGNYKLAAIGIYTNNLPKQDSLAATFFENGAAFNDPNTKSIAVQSNVTTKLNDLVLSKANGAISGTLFEGTPAQPLTTGDYFLFAFDAAGYLVKYSLYSPEINPVDGTYLLTGLRPGAYYLLATVYDENADRYFSQWFGGAIANIDVETFTPKVAVPSTVMPITVGDGLVSRKDFHFNLRTSVKDKSEAESARSFALQQNYPNPFNPSTMIAYELPAATHVEIKVFNLLGKEVATLVNQTQFAGAHEARWNAAHIPSGVYIVRMQAGRFKQAKKCLLLK